MTGQSYDFIVVGGGLAGAAISYYLTLQKRSVLLLEAHTLCSGSSGACAGRAQIFESESESYLDLVLAGFSKLESLGAELGCDLEWETPGHLSLIQDAGKLGSLFAESFMAEAAKCPGGTFEPGPAPERSAHSQSGKFSWSCFCTRRAFEPFSFVYGVSQCGPKTGCQNQD